MGRRPTRSPGRRELVLASPQPLRHRPAPEDNYAVLLRLAISLVFHSTILVVALGLLGAPSVPSHDQRHFQSQIDSLAQQLAELKLALVSSSPPPPPPLADGTGLADFALKSAGGMVTFPTAGLFDPNPEVAISPGVAVGECWPCRIPHCRLRIRLVNRIIARAVSLEHVPKSLSVSRGDTSPKTFAVYDHETSELLGRFEYHRLGVQTFNLSIAATTQQVELDVESSHGGGSLVCLYRFRVHGQLLGDNQSPDSDPSSLGF
ncbi:hypothetical protein BASA82_001274 [Batrachochytrium salamandrivorans]|nr:hypothetical protein BASA82_001274 [Batrachochytrium salamandrivorans]